jgi:hypothetical protein
MALSTELIEHERLRELALESDRLRHSFHRQCAAVKTPTFWIEQGVSVGAWWLGSQNKVGRLLAMASSYLS